MPPLGLHMTAARALAGEISSPLIEADRGAYYLGATTPDIRVLTRWDRARTHFFDLDDFEHQDSVHRLFEQSPQLRDVAALDAPTRAFIAGYLSHLVLDEAYITQIYRPIFGERSQLHGDVMANVMDRLLQWELDRRDREDPASVEDITQSLAETAVEVTVDFIARDTLLEWRKVSVDVISHPPTWERFGKMARRHLSAAGIDDDEGVTKFMDGAPVLLDRTLESVGQDRIREYLESSRQRALETMKEYLS